MDPTSLEEAYEFLVEQPLFANPTEDYLSFLSMVDGALNALAPPPLHAPDSADLDDESNDNEEALPDNATA
jgi:hypothetical protein